MPPELLLPAFALVLVANAILIAIAIRTFTGEAAPEPAEARPGAAVGAARETPGPAAASAPEVAATATRPGARSPRATSTDGRHRRRFALPPMEEDHERFDRAIAAFLSGGKSADGD